MIRVLREIRLSWPAFALLAGASTLASVFVVASALGRSPAQSAALAALRGHPQVVQLAAAPSTTTADASAPPPGAGTATATVAQGSGSSGTDSVTGSGSGAVTSSADDATDTVPVSDSALTDTTTATTTTSRTTTTTIAANSGLPKVGHVFLIALSTPSYAAAFGAKSAAPYLRSLAANGALLRGYRSLGRGELADYLAIVSGQGPNRDTSSGCPTYTEFPRATTANADGLVGGAGCVYPETALTIGDQVSASGHVWKAYIEGMGSTACVHPNSNAVDDVALPGSRPGYDTRHNPFIYFHSLLDLGDCENDDVDLSQLPGDLAKRSATATLSYIAPGICADPAGVPGTTTSSAATLTTTTTASTPPTTATAPTASTPATTATTTTATGTTTAAAGSAAPSTTTPQTAPSTSTLSTTNATNSTSSTSTAADASATPAFASCQGAPLGIVAENAFLRRWVPQILRSAAYKRDGVLVIAFAPAGLSAGKGPARTGALVLSRYIRKATTIVKPYNAYSLLRSVEDLLDYRPLAHAANAASFAATVLG